MLLRGIGIFFGVGIWMGVTFCLRYEQAWIRRIWIHDGSEDGILFRCTEVFGMNTINELYSCPCLCLSFPATGYQRALSSPQDRYRYMKRNGSRPSPSSTPPPRPAISSL